MVLLEEFQDTAVVCTEAMADLEVVEELIIIPIPVQEEVVDIVVDKVEAGVASNQVVAEDPIIRAPTRQTLQEPDQGTDRLSSPLFQEVLHLHI
jgi:hypothetical protein